MLYLVSNVVLAFAITHAHAVFFQVRRRLNILIVLIFLATEPLVDQIQKDPLSHVGELRHLIKVARLIRK